MRCTNMTFSDFNALCNIRTEFDVRCKFKLIDNNIKNLQNIVGGAIEILRLCRYKSLIYGDCNIVLVCNDIGACMRLPPSLLLVRDNQELYIYGNSFFCLECGRYGDFVDLPPFLSDLMLNLMSNSNITIYDGMCRLPVLETNILMREINKLCKKKTHKQTQKHKS